MKRGNMYCLHKNILTTLEPQVLLAHHYGLYGSFTKNLKLFAKMILAILCLSRAITVVDKGSPKTVFFLSAATERKDHKESYANVLGLVKEKRLLTYEIYRKLWLGRTMKLLCFSACELFRNRSMDVGVNFILLERKIRANDVLAGCFNIDFNGMNLAVVYTDEHIEEYAFVSYMKYLGIKTATLQHGAFIAKREVTKPSFDYMGIELRSSRADYFLAWNEFTKEQALKSGMQEEKISVLGIPKFINSVPIVKPLDQAEQKNKFGVILNGVGLADSNEDLVKFANALAKKKNKKFYLKYHPGFKAYIYDSIVEKEYFAGNLPFGSTISEYMKQVDFTLMSNSTVFIEFVFLHHKVYRYNTGEYDKFRDVKIDSFTNEAELFQLIEQNTDSTNGEIFRYLCHTEKPQETYRSFFENFI